MKKIFLGLAMMVILGMIMWLVVERSTAQDSQPKPPEQVDKGSSPSQPSPSQPETKSKPPRPRPPMGQQVGVSEALSNANVQRENQRHREVMDDLYYQVSDLQEKIRTARRTKTDELNNQNKAESGKTVNSVPPEKIKEEPDKVIESFRPETEKLAALVSAELILYQKNLAEILVKEQAEINKKITDSILLQDAHRPGRPPRPPAPEQRRPRKDPETKPDASKPADAPK